MLEGATYPTIAEQGRVNLEFERKQVVNGHI